MSAPSLFLSYVRENREFVERLRRDLHEAGVSVWRDKESLQPTEAWRKAIQKAIRDQDVFAVVVSRAAVSRDDSELIRECRYAQALHGPLRKAIKKLTPRPLSRIKSNKIVQLIIDGVSGKEIDQFFKRHRIERFNEYNRIDLYESYDDAFASLVGVVDIEAMRRRREEKGKGGDLVIRGWRIDQMPLYQTFDPPVGNSEIATELAPSRPIPKSLSKYFDAGVDEQVKKLQGQGSSVTINLGYGASKVIFDKNQKDSGLGRSHRPRIVFEDADYRHQLMYSNRLDVEGLIAVDDSTFTIREYLRDFVGIDFSKFSWDDIPRIPFPQRFANVVNLVVSGVGDNVGEDGLVVGIRAKQAAVRNPGQPSTTVGCTVSCAEGMLRPDDARADGSPSPTLTAVRALYEELGLKAGEHFILDDVRTLALGYDIKRCQPVASHLVRLPTLSFHQVLERWQHAPDRAEHSSLVWIPMKETAFDLFMSDKWIHQGRTLSLFSNHQRFGAATLGQHFFGNARGN